MCMSSSVGNGIAEFQIPQGFVESDEEDELYEEVKDIPGNYIVS